MNELLLNLHVFQHAYCIYVHYPTLPKLTFLLYDNTDSKTGEYIPDSVTFATSFDHCVLLKFEVLHSLYCIVYSLFIGTYCIIVLFEMNLKLCFTYT